MTRLSAPEFAELAGITRQAAHKAFLSCATGGQWRGCALHVTETCGALGGGRSGKRYEVALNSLSEALQARYRSLYPAAIQLPALVAAPVRRPAPNQTAEIARRLPVVNAITMHPRGSAERAVEIAAQAAKLRQGERTIRRWVDDYEAAGFAANSLARKLPSDAGKPRVHVSRQFDKAFAAAGYPVEQLAAIGEEATRLIKAAWISRAGRAGAGTVKVEVSTALARHCRGLGVPMADDPTMMPDRRIRDLARFRIAGKFREDARWAHNHSPREKRDWSLLAPMEMVCADVKIWDNLVVRADGTTKTPAFIGFLDCATLRMFGQFFLIGKGEGIRQEHVLDVFLDMVQNHEWGFPERLYLDNGGEFAAFEVIRDSMSKINDLDGREIIYARPYHGSSKPIESRFAWFQRYVSSTLPGYVGGALGRPLTHQHGKKAKPYTGSFDQFAQEAMERIAVLEHNHVFKSGNFKGRTSASVFEDWCANNWRPTLVAVEALDAAFHRQVTKRVYDRGIVRLQGEWTHPEIHDLIGERIDIALPWRRGASPMFKHPVHNWTTLQERLPYHPLDKAGADAGRKTQKAVVRSIRRSEDEAGSIDLDQNHRDRVAVLPPEQSQRKLRLLRVVASPDATAMVAARIADTARPSEAESADQHNRNRRKALTAALEKKHGTSY